MRYGLPFQGSKNKLALWVLEHLPSVSHLYDVFAGGCAVSHAAILSGKYGCVHFSDINDSVLLFCDCLEGNIPDGSEWISREEFERRKHSDPYVRLVWSFGNNQRDYLYGREIEPYKKAVHEMIFAKTPTERRLKFREVCCLMSSIGGGDRQITSRASGERRCRLQHSEPQLPPRKCYDQQNAEAFNRVRAIAERGAENVNRGRTLTVLQSEERRRAMCDAPFCGGEYEAKVCDYREADILPDSVVYCDIPYKGTKPYRESRNTFDYEAFYAWCEQQSALVVVSEYWMPEERFVCIAERERKSSFSATNNALSKVERLFVPKHQYELWQELMKRT